MFVSTVQYLGVKYVPSHIGINGLEEGAPVNMQQVCLEIVFYVVSKRSTRKLGGFNLSFISFF